MNKYPTVPTSFPEINLKHLHALHPSTTRCPCLPSICCKELTLACLQSACLSMMCSVWTRRSWFRQDSKAYRFLWYGQRMFQNIKNNPQTVRVNFWKLSNLYCLSRKIEKALKHSREKGLMKTALGKFGTNKALPREHQPGKCCPKQLLAPCLRCCPPHWGLRGS